MSERAHGLLWLLLSGALVGCAAVPHTEKEQEEGCEQQATSFEEVCQQEGTLPPYSRQLLRLPSNVLDPD